MELPRASTTPARGGNANRVQSSPCLFDHRGAGCRKGPLGPSWEGPPSASGTGATASPPSHCAGALGRREPVSERKKRTHAQRGRVGQNKPPLEGHAFDKMSRICNSSRGKNRRKTATGVTQGASVAAKRHISGACAFSIPTLEPRRRCPPSPPRSFAASRPPSGKAQGAHPPTFLSTPTNPLVLLRQTSPCPFPAHKAENYKITPIVQTVFFFPAFFCPVRERWIALLNGPASRVGSGRVGPLSQNERASHHSKRTAPCNPHLSNGNLGVRHEVVVDARSMGEDGLPPLLHIVEVQNHLHSGWKRWQ